MFFMLSSVWTSKFDSDQKAYFSFKHFDLLWFPIILESMIYYGHTVISYMYKSLLYTGIKLFKN